ncbi:MAG: hypothetical protein NTV21_06830 [Planctomycetota bacterium]|nr:hypothetical protein [Planctomycetota bacterium]
MVTSTSELTPRAGPAKARGGWWPWLPRVLALAFTAFLSLFALDAFEGVEGLAQRAVALAMHLVPTAVCLLLVVLAWRRPWIGAASFGVLAAAYVGIAWSHPSWVLVISGPLALVALAYFIAWRREISRARET